MAGEIAQAFVRVRPNLTGFQAETEGGIKSALVSIGKITAGFFAVRSITNEFKHIADAAAEHQASFAVLDQTIKNAHASTKAFGTSIEALLEREAKLKGFTDEELASGFTRLVSVTKDSGQAFKDLSAAEDVSRARHIDVATSSLALSRALQGSTISLSRLGIIIPKVGTEEAKLHAEHDRLAASGVKFTGSVKAAYEAQLKAAKAADAQSTRLSALAAVQDRFGGSAKAFAEGAAGRFQRFDVSVHLLEVSLGKLLLPTLSKVTGTVTHWVDELTTSERVHHDVSATVELVSHAFSDLRATVQFLEPVLRPVVGLLEDIVGSSGAGGILVAVGAFKAVGAATEVAAAAQRKYLELVELGRGNVEEDAAARQASVSATGQASAALERHAALLGEDAAASTRAAAGTAEFTGSLRANELAIAASTATNAARGGEIAGTTAGQAATAGPDVAASANAAAAAATGAESLKELSQAASDAGTSIGDTANSVGSLASDIDHSGNVISKAASQASKASLAHKGLAKTTTEAASAERSLDAAQTQGLATSGRRTGTLAAETQTLKATGAARQGLAAVTVRSSLQESEALLATARAAEIGSREQAAAYEAAAAAALKAEAATVGAAERSAEAIGIAGTSEERIARQRILAQLQVARANPLGSPRQIQAYEEANRRARELAGAEAAVGDAAVASGAKVAGAAGTVEGALAGEDAALNGSAAAAGRSAAANEALAALGRENAAAANDLAAASAKAGPALTEETAAINASAAAAERAAVANAELADSLLAVSAASAKASIAQLPAGGGPIKEAGQEIEKTVASTGRLTRAASSAGAALKGLGRSALAFIGGTPTLIAAGAAAFSFLVYKAVTAETDLERESDRVSQSIVAMGKDLRAAASASKALAEAQRSLPTDRIQVEEARLALARAQSALATTDAARGTLQYRQLTIDLASAQDQLRQAEHQVGVTEDTIAANRAKRAAAEKQAAKDREASLKRELGLLDKIRTNAPPPPTGTRAPLGGPSLNTVLHPVRSAEAFGAVIKDAFDSRSAVQKAVDSINDEAKKLDKEGFPKLALHLRDLAELAKATNKFPPKRIVGLFYSTNALDAAKAIAAVSVSQERHAKSTSEFVRGLDKERRAIAANDPALAKRFGLVENLIRATGRKLPPQVVQFIFRSNVEAGIRRMISELDRAGVSVKAFGRAAEHEVDAFRSSNPDLARRIEILRQFGALVGRLPNRHETEVVLKAPTSLGAVIALQKELATMDGAAKRHGKKSGEDWARQFFAGLTKIPFLDSAFKGLAENAGKAARATVDDALGKAAITQLKGQLATAKQVVDTAKQGVQAAEQSLADARQSVRDAQSSLAEAITSGQQQIADSLKSAGSNLISIGQSLSDDISKFFDAQSAKKTGGAAATGPLADRLKELTKLIHEGHGTPAIIQKAKEVEAELNAQQDKASAPSSDKRKERVQRRLADLTDEFNTGKISLARFNREVTALLKREHINYRNAGRVLGVAFADGFRAELIGLRQQAAAIAKFGRRPGLGAFGVTVEKPAEVRSKVQEGIARDQEAIAKAQNTVLKDIKAVSAKERTLAAANLKADHIRTQLATANRHQATTANNTTTLVKQNAQLLKDAKERASNSATLPGRAGPVASPTAALVLPVLNRGEKAKSGSAEAKRIGREAIRDFEALGGELGAGLRHGLARGERRFFQQLEDLIRGGHRHARKTARSGSPSLLFAEFGDELAEGVALGVSRSTPLLERAASLLVGKAARASAIVRQRVRVERAFEVRGSLAAFLAKAEKDIPASLSPKAVRQQIRVTRTLAERESVKQIFARAEQVGSLAAGRANVTVLVGANIRPANRVIDELRRTAERRGVSLGVHPAATSALQRAATPRLAPPAPPAASAILRGVARPKAAPTLPLPAAIPALEKGIEPLRESVANRQRGTLIGEERRQARLLEQILVEERKQTVLLREEVGPRPRRRNPKKNPREATREATATAIHNLLGS